MCSVAPPSLVASKACTVPFRRQSHLMMSGCQACTHCFKQCSSASSLDANPMRMRFLEFLAVRVGGGRWSLRSRVHGEPLCGPRQTVVPPVSASKSTENERYPLRLLWACLRNWRTQGGLFWLASAKQKCTEMDMHSSSLRTPLFRYADSSDPE